jgi:hypothetical protein
MTGDRTSRSGLTVSSIGRFSETVEQFSIENAIEAGSDLANNPCVRDAAVAGSNPAAPTIFSRFCWIIARLVSLVF